MALTCLLYLHPNRFLSPAFGEVRSMLFPQEKIYEKKLVKLFG